MARSAVAAVAAVAMASGVEARTHAKPAHVLKMKQRTRPIKDEQTTRLSNLHKHVSALKLDVIGSEFSSSYDSPVQESEAYYAYPLTLDYVVDVAFQNGTDGTMVEYPVIVDTGSSNLAVAVDSCTNCNSGSTSLNLGWYGESSDSELCIDVTYGSGSWDGMMTDEVKVGFIDDSSSLVDNVYLAGITSQDGFFCGGFYGILGLAYSGLTESYSTCTSSSSSGGSSSGGSSGGGGGGQSRGGQMRGGQAMGGRGQTRSQPQAHQTTAGRGHEAVGAQARSSTTRAPQPNDSEHHTIPGQTRGTKSTHTAETGYTTPKQAPVSPRATQAHRAMSEVTAEELEASATMSSTPLLDSFYEDGLVTDNVFSILFCGDAASMAIGGVDTSQVSADDTVGLTMVDTQKTYDEIYGYFLVEVSEVSVDDTVVSTDSSDLNEIGGVLVDSGTTLIYLPSSVTSAIETEVESAVSSLDSSFFQWSSCVDESELSNFPDLTLALDGYDLVLSPYQYLLWYSDCYYWGISSSSIPIIGNVALQGKLVVFDKEANQIGFADGDCSAYGGTSFEDDASSKTAEDAVVMPEQGGMTGQVLAAVQGASEHVSGAAVAGGAMVVLGVGFVLARGRGRKSGFAAVPEDEDEFAI